MTTEGGLQQYFERNHEPIVVVGKENTRRSVVGGHAKVQFLAKVERDSA